MEHTNEGGKGVHSETGPQDNEQICLGEVLLEVLEEASRQALAKEHNVGLHETLCSTAQHMVGLHYKTLRPVAMSDRTCVCVAQLTLPMMRQTAEQQLRMRVGHNLVYNVNCKAANS